VPFVICAEYVGFADRQCCKLFCLYR